MKKSQTTNPELFKAIFEYATLSIILVDVNGIVRLTNPCFNQLFGYSQDEITGKRIDLLIPEEFRPKHKTLMQGYFNNPQRRKIGIGLELSAVKKNGVIFPVEISLGYFEAETPMAIVFLTDISNRKQTELALYEDEKRLRDIIQSINDAFMGFSTDWRYLYVNDKALVILGKSRKEVLGKTIWEVFPSALGSNFENEFRVKHKGKITPFSFQTHHANTWWEVRITRYNSGMALICSDITETRYAREAQAQSEEQFSVIFNSSPAAISISDLHTGIIRNVNQAFTRLFGFSKSELNGKTMLELGITKDVENRKEIIQSVYNHGTLRYYEMVAYNKDGYPMDLHVSADIIHLDGKEYLLVASTDITASKIQLAELKYSEERFEKAFRQSPVALAITTLKDERILEVNKSFLELFNYKLHEVIGKTTAELNINPDLPEQNKIYDQLMSQGYIRNTEVVTQTKDKKKLHVIISMELIELRGEQCAITTALDITDKKKAEEEIKNYTDLLEQKVANRTLELTHALEREKEVSDMKSRFVSIASHEFRTPLSTILSSTFLLEQMKEGEDKIKHYQRIRSAVKNLNFILTEFLSLDKLEQRKVTVENEIFDMDTLVSEVIDEVRIAYKLLTPMEYTHTGPRLLFQDKRIIRNILLNLISNAAKYSPADKSIRINTTKNDAYVSIEVVDEGMGIPLEDQKYIFTKFFRAENVNHIQGTGLGLSIVKRYVELLNGKVNFNSTLNQGSSFTVSIPVLKT